jgi:hypothetical protein
MEATRSRPETTYRFSIPEKLQADCGGAKSMVLKELTAQDELMASKRASGDAFALAFELAKQSLVELDGEKVNVFDHTIDLAFGKLGPKGRSLVLSAYSKIHSPQNDDIESFLGSREVRVG